VLRLVLSPRWIVWHVLTLGAMVTCGFLSVWQWRRAGSAMGSALNIGYGVQWPIFAVFFGVMWWRFLRMEIRALQEPGADAPAERVDTSAGVPADVPVSTPAAGRTPAPPAVVGEALEPPGWNSGAAAVHADTGDPSPFRRTPGRPAPVTDEHNPALAEYNRMLAALAERDDRAGNRL